MLGKKINCASLSTIEIFMHKAERHHAFSNQKLLSTTLECCSPAMEIWRWREEEAIKTMIA